MRSSFLAAVLLGLAATTSAQEGSRSDAEWRSWQPEASDVALVDVAVGKPKAKNFDKYFYFHRSHTDFDEALFDVRECDARARGWWRSPEAKAEGWDGETNAYGLVGTAAQAFLFGPAQERLARRATLRRCMFYKGYARYGISKEAWTSFNYARSNGDRTEAQMQQMLAQQARLASGPHPQIQELGL